MLGSNILIPNDPPKDSDTNTRLKLKTLIFTRTYAKCIFSWFLKWLAMYMLFLFIVQNLKITKEIVTIMIYKSNHYNKQTTIYTSHHSMQSTLTIKERTANKNKIEKSMSCSHIKIKNSANILFSLLPRQNCEPYHKHSVIRWKKKIILKNKGSTNMSNFFKCNIYLSNKISVTIKYHEYAYKLK